MIESFGGWHGKRRHTTVETGRSANDNPVQHEFAWAREYSAEEWVQLLRTQSDHRMLPPRQLDELTAAISQVVREHGGRYRHPYVCYLWAAQKY